MFGGVCCIPKAFLNKNMTTDIFMKDVMVIIARGATPNAVMTRIRVAGFDNALFIIE